MEVARAGSVALLICWLSPKKPSRSLSRAFSVASKELKYNFGRLKLMPTEMKLCGITAKVTKAQIAQTLVRRPVLTTYIIIVFIFVSVCLNPVRFEARYEQRMMATHTSEDTYRILDALQLALISHALYFYLITNYANPSIIYVPPWSLRAHIIVTALSDIIIQLYFTRRVWIMSQGNWILAGVSVRYIKPSSSTLLTYVNWCYRVRES